SVIEAVHAQAMGVDVLEMLDQWSTTAWTISEMTENDLVPVYVRCRRTFRSLFLFCFCFFCCSFPIALFTVFVTSGSTHGRELKARTVTPVTPVTRGNQRVAWHERDTPRPVRARLEHVKNFRLLLLLLGHSVAFTTCSMTQNGERFLVAFL